MYFSFLPIYLNVTSRLNFNHSVIDWGKHSRSFSFRNQRTQCLFMMLNRNIGMPIGSLLWPSIILVFCFCFCFYINCWLGFPTCIIKWSSKNWWGKKISESTPHIPNKLYVVLVHYLSMLRFLWVVNCPSTMMISLWQLWQI